MFGLGTWEIVVILIVVLVAVKPSDIPKMLRTVGRAFRRFREMYRGVSSTISDLGREIENPEVFSEMDKKSDDLLRNFSVKKESTKENGSS